VIKWAGVRYCAQVSSGQSENQSAFEETGKEEVKKMSKPRAITDDTFKTEVFQSDTPVLVDFWAEWCGPCKMIAPILEEIADERNGDLDIVKLDVDAHPRTAMEYGVMGIPTLILFKDGEPVERITGYLPKERFLERLEPHLN
jgi:thioredoxin 1